MPDALRMLPSQSLPIYLVSVSSSPNCAFCLASALSNFLSRAALVLARLASISSLRTLSRAFSALALWIYHDLSACDYDQSSLSTYVLNQRSLVLEGITLAEVVEFMVEMLVDLTAGTVLHEETTENTKTAHPDDLAISISECVQCPPHPRDFSIPRHTSICRTLPLTETTVSTNSSGSSEFPCARSRVHGDGLSDDEAICD